MRCQAERGTVIPSLGGVHSYQGCDQRTPLFEPRVPIGAEVGRGQEIGISQAPDRALKDVPPYLHVELYLHDTRTVLDEVEKFVTERWPQIRSTLPTIRARVNLDLRKILKKAFKKERERDYEEAIRYFREALPEPWFEVTNTDILHYLARSLVNAGRFEEAVEVQSEMVRLLELEKAYAEGGLPDPELGTIARHMRLESLDMFIMHMKANLEAYERDQQTVYVY